MPRPDGAVGGPRGAEGAEAELSQSDSCCFCCIDLMKGEAFNFESYDGLPSAFHSSQLVHGCPGAGCAKAVWVKAQQGKAMLIASTRQAMGFPAQCPVCWALGWSFFLLLVIGVGMAVLPPSVETNFDAFMKTDVVESLRRDVFLYSLKEMDDKPARRLLGEELDWSVRAGDLEDRDSFAFAEGELDAAFDRLGGEERRLQAGYSLYMHFDLMIAYDAKDLSSPGIFNSDVIAGIADFESHLRAQPSWQDFCKGVASDSRIFCQTGISFTNYAVPSLNISLSSIVPTDVFFDGRGVDVVPFPTAMYRVRQNEMEGIIFPKGFDSGANANYSADGLRSAFRFSFICCSSTDAREIRSKRIGELTTSWKGFVQETVIPSLQGRSAGGVRAFFAGTSIKEIEVMYILSGDLVLAGGSMGFVLFYLLVHTRSILLSVSSLLVILLSVPFSYVLFAICTGTQEMSIASFLSLFIIVGFGSDVVFVYADIFRDSPGTSHERLAYTYHHAGKASLATTATTAVSFFANMASVLKALREFGFFMGLCVTSVWILLTLIFAPLCLVDDGPFCRGCRLVCRDRGRAKDGRPAFRSLMISAQTVCVHRGRHICLLIAALIMIFFVATSITSVVIDTSAPEILPPEHNQIKGAKVMELFSPVSDIFSVNYYEPETSARVCSPGVPHASMQHRRRRGSSDVSCPIFWCEVTSSDPPLPRNECDCYRNVISTNSSCSSIVVKSRFVAPPDLWKGVQIKDVVRPYMEGVSPQLSLSEATVEGDSPMHLQDWRTGITHYNVLTELKATYVRALQNVDPGLCEVEDTCFCGTRVCDFPENEDSENSPKLYEKLSARLSLPLPGRRLEATSLSPLTVRAESRTWVDVVFGLQVNPKSPILGKIDFAGTWGFDPVHDPAQPWAQRNMLSFCNNLDIELLRITETRCWIQNFAEYVEGSGRKFPVTTEFHTLVNQWAATNTIASQQATTYLWFRGGKLKASRMMFQIDVNRESAVPAAQEHQERWDAYLRSYNAEASMFAYGTWHTSDLWVRTQVLQELASSTVSTVAIVLLLAFFGMLGFTGDFWLAIFVVLATTFVISGILFFIVVVNKWPVGPVEVISLIVFIGYATTYSLHVAHRYGSPDSIIRMTKSEQELPSAVRYQRTLWSLQSIGGAALGSAITTAGCSVFLLQCQMPIFQKLGAVVLIVTVFSIVTALGPLSAVLMILGPSEPGCLGSICCCRRRRSSSKEPPPKREAREVRGRDKGRPAPSEVQQDPVGSKNSSARSSKGAESQRSQPSVASQDALLSGRLSLDTRPSRQR